MKAAIIILGNSWICPYAKTYKDIFEKLGCAYDVILWDRDGSDASAPIRYCSGNTNLENPVLKAMSYIGYSRFVKKTILKNSYDRLVVSGPHLAILLSSFLRKRYNGRYIIDYRDISVEQKPVLYNIYSKVLAGSCCNVISSPGFKKYLPCGYNYYISHNFDHEKAVRALNGGFPPFDMVGPLRILTIGSIRNYSSNVKIIQSLANNADYSLSFVGRGDASELLKEYTFSNNVSNVSFSGFYKKDDESSIVEKCDFINIFFPDDVEHSTIMSNRFYLALIHKKPVIVTAGSTQATLVQKYALGVVTTVGCENLDAEIKRYISTFDYASFCKRCNELLSVFVEEYRSLENAVAGLFQA